MIDFTNKIKEFSKRVELIKDNLQTEEATKTALVLPFIQQILGYDIFNPLEVVPELTADVGIKKGEKVDYGIIIDNKPLIVIETKHITSELDKEINQLYRYYTSIKDIKFGVLTNGIVYKFFTDLEHKNMMDQKPFLEINLLDINEDKIKELYLFTKNVFNVDNILSKYENINFETLIEDKINKELINPSDDFINLLVKDIDLSLSENEMLKVKLTATKYLRDILTKVGIEVPPIQQVITVDTGKTIPTNNPANTQNIMTLTLSDKFTGLKPIALTIDNTKIEGSSWIKLLIGACIYLGQDNLNKFAKLESVTRGTKSNLISKNKSTIRKPFYIKELDIYIETNISTEYIISVLKKILRYYNKDINKIKVEVRDIK